MKGMSVGMSVQCDRVRYSVLRQYVLYIVCVFVTSMKAEDSVLESWTELLVLLAQQ